MIGIPERELSIVLLSSRYNLALFDSGDADLNDFSEMMHYESKMNSSAKRTFAFIGTALQASFLCPQIKYK